MHQLAELVALVLLPRGWPCMVAMVRPLCWLCIVKTYIKTIKQEISRAVAELSLHSARWVPISDVQLQGSNELMFFALCCLHYINMQPNATQ